MKKIVGIAVSLLALVTSAFGQIGSPTSDLVFTPVAPCRIVDTRVVGGQILGLNTRSFKASGANFSAQGGSSTSCGIPVTTDVAALALNLVAAWPAADGWIAAYPFGDIQPNASSLNFKAGDVLANTAILKVSQAGAAYDWTLYTTTTTHFVADVVGFYSRPMKTSFECESPTSSVLIPANSTGLGSKFCTAGFTLTGGGCGHALTDSSVLISKSIPLVNNDGWFCRWQNTAAVENTAYTYARCCRIAGR